MLSSNKFKKKLGNNNYLLQFLWEDTRKYSLINSRIEMFNAKAKQRNHYNHILNLLLR